MRRNTGIETRKENLRVVGQRNVLGIDESPDGTYSTINTETKSHRLVTYFPVDGKQPQTVENFAASKHTEEREWQSFPEEDEDDPLGDFSTSISSTSLPKNCPSCGGGMLVSSSPGLHGDGKEGLPRSPTELRCRTCGKSLHVALSNSSLPEQPGTSNRTFELAQIKPASSLPPNVTLGTQTKGVNNSESSNDDRIKVTHNRINELQTGNESVGEPNGGLTGSSSSEASSASEAQVQIEREQAKDLALKLYKLDGFTKDEVAPELSKK
jgi:hypothetical protein